MAMSRSLLADKRLSFQRNQAMHHEEADLSIPEFDRSLERSIDQTILEYAVLSLYLMKSKQGRHFLV